MSRISIKLKNNGLRRSVSEPSLGSRRSTLTLHIHSKRNSLNSGNVNNLVFEYEPLDLPTTSTRSRQADNNEQLKHELLNKILRKGKCCGCCACSCKKTNCFQPPPPKVRPEHSGCIIDDILQVCDSDSDICDMEDDCCGCCLCCCRNKSEEYNNCKQQTPCKVECQPCQIPICPVYMCCQPNHNAHDDCSYTHSKSRHSAPPDLCHCKITPDMSCCSTIAANSCCCCTKPKKKEKTYNCQLIFNPSSCNQNGLLLMGNNTSGCPYPLSGSTVFINSNPSSNSSNDICEGPICTKNYNH